MLDWMPVQASTWAEKVDWVNNFITYVSVFCTIMIVGAMIYFAVRYRRKSEDQATEYITHNVTLETVWTVIPTIVCLFVFYYGIDVYQEMRTPPTNAMQIDVQAFKWRWEFTYPNGKKSTDELVVPLGKPVRLSMKSADVIHSFFVPAMRVKEDVLPSMYTYTWFEATKEGEFPVFCAEYCGLNHSYMRATLKVVSPEAYRDYIYERGNFTPVELPPKELGQKLFSEKGCVACHMITGAAGLGPTLKGVFGRETELADGQKIAADENYIQESILNPNAKIRKGFQPNIMTAYEGQLSEKELSALVAYLRTL